MLYINVNKKGGIFTELKNYRKLILKEKIEEKTRLQEDEIKSAQKLLIKRAIYAVAIFFVVLIVQLVFGLLDTTGDEAIEAGSTSWVECWNKY